MPYISIIDRTKGINPGQTFRKRVVYKSRVMACVVTLMDCQKVVPSKTASLGLFHDSGPQFSSRLSSSYMIFCPVVFFTS